MAEPARNSASGFTRNTALLAPAVMAVLTLAQIFFIYTRFITRAVDDCSSKAVRDAVHIKRMFSSRQLLERRLFPAEVIRKTSIVQEDFRLWKIKFFSPGGEVVCSTDQGDIGGINEHEYFRERVARSEVYAIPVWAMEVT